MSFINDEERAILTSLRGDLTNELIDQKDYDTAKAIVMDRAAKRCRLSSDGDGTSLLVGAVTVPHPVPEGRTIYASPRESASSAATQAAHHRLFNPER